MRLAHAVRRLVEWMLPWYDPDQDQVRRRETERVRRRSIAARAAAQDVARRYERYDDVLRP